MHARIIRSTFHSGIKGFRQIENKGKKFINRLQKTVKAACKYVINEIRIVLNTKYCVVPWCPVLLGDQLPCVSCKRFPQLPVYCGIDRSF